MVIRRIALIAALGLLLSAQSARAAFPGHNGKIAFVSNRDAAGTGNLEIYTMNPDGSDVTRLTTDPLPDDDPAWSPDGSRIVFSGSRDGQSGIVVMNADGSGQTRITGPGFFYPTGDPFWSPDGRRIVFQGYTGTGSVELYLINADGSGLTRLTSNDTSDLTPAWSPDGREIAFSRFVSPCTAVVCNFEIFVMDADGTNERRLTFDSDQDSDPNWSPDGTKIAWGNLDDLTDVEVMNADGTDRRSFSPPARGYEPAWSPDGAMITWAGFGSLANVNEINVMNADGTGQHPISNAPSFEDAPDWQPLNRPPNCDTVAATPGTLLPANRMLEPVALSGATDPDGDPVEVTVTGVTQDEPVTANGDPTSPDAAGGGAPNEVKLRAERNPKGDGRVYQVAFTTADGRGGSCESAASVAVPRHQSQPAVDSAPPSYDSLAR